MGKVVKQIWLKNAKCYELEKYTCRRKGLTGHNKKCT